MNAKIFPLIHECGVFHPNKIPPLAPVLHGYNDIIFSPVCIPGIEILINVAWRTSLQKHLVFVSSYIYVNLLTIKVMYHLYSFGFEFIYNRIEGKITQI
jgi:hypothetical protein